jgi:hypothetical protein
MSIRIVSLLVSMLLFQAYAAAGTIYDNGPKNDDSTAWNFTGQDFASDTFTVSGGSSTVSGVSIWVLIFPTDHNPTAEITITSQANGGNVYFDQVLQFSESNCYAAGWGYNWCEETAAWENGPVLPNGTYWVNLKNGSLPSGGPVFWNQNSGVGCNSPGCPSQAENSFGTIPSEAFTILGTPDGSKSSTPKTTSLLMFGAGFLGVVGIIRKKID